LRSSRSAASPPYFSSSSSVWIVRLDLREELLDGLLSRLHRVGVLVRVADQWNGTLCRVGFQDAAAQAVPALDADGVAQRQVHTQDGALAILRDHADPAVRGNQP
jgi:hypothetical protein